MNNLIKVLLVVFISFLSSPSWSETFQDLVWRDGLYYKKFTNTPFTGELSGRDNGKIKNGLIVGKWLTYRDNGQLFLIEHYKDGNGNGLWEEYYSNGRLHYKGIYKDDKKDGLWKYYNEDGSLQKTETWIDGVKQ